MRYLRKKIFPLFHIAQLLFLRKWTQSLGYIHFFSFFIGPKTSLYGLNTSLVGQRTLLMSELDKFGALNLRAESEKVKNNYRTTFIIGVMF